MQNISHKILSVCLCVAYVLASCGFVRHVCNTNGIAYASLLAADECTYCLQHKNDNQQCCHHAETQPQSADDDCCEKTVETISSDQNYSQGNNISESIFFTITAVLFSVETDLICKFSAKTSETYTPLINAKTPLIYHIEQLRL
ncbi:MAG: hypothetical protein LBT27_00810 [Prevotellaceae bacterium]|nr:hypothetical protein [Prevotellaceae bacterium]